MANPPFSSWLGFLARRSSVALLVLFGAVSSPFLFSASPVAAQSPTVLYISPPSQNVSLGSTARVDVVIQDVTNLYGAEIHLAFDPARLSVQDADPNRTGTQIQAGPLLTSGTYFVAVNSVDNSLGTITLALTQLNPTLPVTGSGSVAQVEFKARGVGTTPIRLASALLSDRNGVTILFATNNTPLTAPSLRAPSNSTIQDGMISITELQHFLFVPFILR